MTGGLPPVDTAHMPESVRKAGPEAQKLYATALSFEGVLEQQLAQALTSTLQSQNDDSSGGSSDNSASQSLLMQMLPDSLSQSLTASGGLGVAQQLYDSLAAQKGATS